MELPSLNLCKGFNLSESLIKGKATLFHKKSNHPGVTWARKDRAGYFRHNGRIDEIVYGFYRITNKERKIIEKLSS